MLDKKLLREVAIEAIRLMYEEIEGWEIPINQIPKNTIGCMEQIIYDTITGSVINYHKSGIDNGKK